MSAQGQALVTAPSKLVVAAPPVAALNNLIHKGSSYTGFIAVTADTVYADADGTMQATNGDTVEVWQSGALEMSYADNTDLERPVLTTSDPLVNGNSVLVFNNTSGPLTSITRSAGILAGHTGLTFIAVLKVTGGLSAGPPLGGQLNNTDNTFAADGTIDEWIGFENTRTLPVKFPLDRYALYAVRGGVTSGNTSVYINDPGVPIYTDTFSDAGFQTTVWIGGTHTGMTGNMVFLSLHKEEMPHPEFVSTVEAIKAVYNVVPTTLQQVSGAGNGGGGEEAAGGGGDAGEEAAGGGGDVGEEAAGDGGDGGDLPPAPVGSEPVVRYSVNSLSAMAHNDVVAAWSNDIIGAAGAAVGTKTGDSYLPLVQDMAGVKFMRTGDGTTSASGSFFTMPTMIVNAATSQGLNVTMVVRKYAATQGWERALSLSNGWPVDLLSVMHWGGDGRWHVYNGTGGELIGPSMTMGEWTVFTVRQQGTTLSWLLDGSVFNSTTVPQQSDKTYSENLLNGNPQFQGSGNFDYLHVEVSAGPVSTEAAIHVYHTELKDALGILTP